ncbi:hypothetical protein SAMN05216189_101134 [Pseudomonas delhiensis]|uniref:Uncharacterized protein n=1 Tax=Pseudomonas delhiensis TaxID=366289 RepID=A0A239K2K0_9PSED|nr:hypothetical protein [Pseudomonas delhiensis]SDI98438.1 hypothetical protein SAMN05216189_101134 [Pseudomonas delhiensis]SNT11314.1 hypothetical protein SAMN06295949_11434 [Pseudomonas delhiensis]
MNAKTKTESPAVAAPPTEQTRLDEYDEYLQQKVDTARASLLAGLGRPNDEVEATFNALRAEALGG